MVSSWTALRRKIWDTYGHSGTLLRPHGLFIPTLSPDKVSQEDTALYSVTPHLSGSLFHLPLSLPLPPLRLPRSRSSLLSFCHTHSITVLASTSYSVTVSLPDTQTYSLSLVTYIQRSDNEYEIFFPSPSLLDTLISLVNYLMAEPKGRGLFMGVWGEKEVREKWGSGELLAGGLRGKGNIDIEKDVWG